MTMRPIALFVSMITILVLLGMTGCIYHSRVEDKLPAPPEKFANKKEKRAPSVGRWWKLFKDPALDRLIGRAFEGSLDLEQAWARLDAAHASVTLVKSGYYPRVSVKGEAGRSQRVFRVGDNNVDTTTNTLSLSLAASYEVDLWGKVRYAVKSARYELKATEEDLRAAYISLAAQMTDHYFRAAELRAQLALLDHTIASRQRHVELVRRRYTEGVVTALDLYQAQGSLANAQARRSSFTRQLKAAEHAIAVLVGRAPGEPLTGALDKLPKQVVDLPPGLPAQLLMRRPDLRAVHQRLMAADASVGAAVAGHYPSLSLTGSVGSIFDPVALVWSVLGSLTAPLFEGMRVTAEVKLQRAQLKLALTQYKAVLLRALQEVEDALVSGQQLKERVRWLEQSVTAAEGSLRLSTDQYAQGLITFLPVLTAEQSVYTARSELLSARRELISARVQLARALGGGWMDAEIKKRNDRRANAKERS